MKVLILNDKFPPEVKGGADIMSWRFAQKLVRVGHQVSVFTTTDQKSREGIAEENSLKIYRLFYKFSSRWMAYAGLYNYKAVRKLKEIIKKEKPDLLWAHNVHCALSYACLRKAKKMGLPVVLSLHDSLTFCYKAFDCQIEYKHKPLKCLKCQRFRYFPLRNFLIRYFLTFVDKIIAVSHEHQKLLQANKVRCDTYIYNGVEPFKKAPKLDIKERVVFWGGRINKAGGIYQIVQALQEIPNVILLVASKIDKSSDALVQYSKEQGVKIKLLGWLDRNGMASAYQSCDVAICASIAFETFGLIPLEAMANKKPAMATCFGGSKEVVTDGVTGYIFNPFNIPNFSKKIIKILNNQELAKQMGEAGYRKYKDKFTLDKVFNNYLDIFNQLLNL